MSAIQLTVPVKQISMLIFMTKTCARFKSKVNDRLFSLAVNDDNSFDFVELLKDIPDPDRTDMRTIYQGFNIYWLRMKIAKELIS